VRHTIDAFIKLLIRPEVWIFIGLSAGCLIAWTRQYPRSARFILSIILALQYGLTTRPLTQALVQPLETYYRPPTTMPVHQDAMVIFVHFPILQPYAERPTIVGTPNTDLLLCGLVYVRAGSAPKVVLAGGPAGALDPTGVGAAVVQEWAVLLGYPSDAIITDNQSIATHERARAMKRWIGSDGKILLLDSAMHLPRSVAAFKKAGFTVTPIPCDYTMSTNSWEILDFVPQAENLKASSAAVHEYVGLLTYWVRRLI